MKTYAQILLEKEERRQKKYTCLLCKKEPAREFLFCEKCLSHNKRKDNFEERLRIILDLEIKRRLKP